MIALPDTTQVQNMTNPDYCHFCLEPIQDCYPCPHCGWSPSAPQKSRLFLKPGTVLHGRFIIARVLSHGEFSTVYLAWGIRENKKLAIKEFLPIGLVDRESQSQNITIVPETQKLFYSGLNRFLDEGLLLGKFRKNPNIVDFHCLFKAHETGYAVMEYVEGVSLGTFIKAKGVLNWQQTLALFSRIMALMDLLHEQGILHSGINPGSIILGKDNQIKLLGFATAKHELSKHMRTNASINVAGYAAEEQYLTNQQEGPWTDVYAIAACMYFCLTGHPPPDSLRIQYSDPLIKPSKLNVKIPENAELGILKGLSINAALRPQSLSDFHAALVKNNTENQAVKADVPEEPVTKTVTPVEIKSTKQPKSTEAPKQTTQKTVMPETTIAEQLQLEKSSTTLKVLYGLLFTCFATASVIVFIDTTEKKISAPENAPETINSKVSADQSNALLFNHAMLLKQQHRDNLAKPIFMHLAKLGDQNAQAIINSMESEKQPAAATESKPAVQEKIQPATPETKATLQKEFELPATISGEELLVSTQNNPNSGPLSKNQLQLALETERLPAPSLMIAQPQPPQAPKSEEIAPVINLNTKPNNELPVSTENNPNSSPLSKNQLQLAVETERLPAASLMIAQPQPLQAPKSEEIAPVINLNTKPNNELLVSTVNNPNSSPLSKNQLQLAVETERLPAASLMIAKPQPLQAPKSEEIAPVINLNAKPIKQNDSADTVIHAIASSNQNENGLNNEDYISKLFCQTQHQERQDLALFSQLIGDSESSSDLNKVDQAKLGIPEIEALLGSLYEKGNGVKQDFYQAQYWYKKAAEHGELSAIYYLEELHRKSISY